MPITTSGDRGANPGASPAGVKGLFVDEIVRALQEFDVDLAVHSAKDLPSEDPEGIVVAAVPERASPYDVLVTRESKIGDGAVVGTSSLRRRGQLRAARPQFEIHDIRGNVDTRLRKLEEGEVDGLVLAAAGLARLGIQPPHVEPLTADVMLPAPGQGAIAIQTRAEVADLFTMLDHAPSAVAFDAERKLTSLLGGGCALPLGAFATVHGQTITLRARVFTPDGSSLVHAEASSIWVDEVAGVVAERLRSRGAERILADLT